MRSLNEKLFVIIIIKNNKIIIIMIIIIIIIIFIRYLKIAYLQRFSGIANVFKHSKETIFVVSFAVVMLILPGNKYRTTLRNNEHSMNGVSLFEKSMATQSRYKVGHVTVLW